MLMKVSEPAIPYHTPELQNLKNRLIATIDASSDVRKLEQCWEVLHAEDLPCAFTDDEFEKELLLSEASGLATDKEVEAMYAKWKH